MPTPCVPTVRTPSHFVGTIADYSPQTCPMVPALMVHCLDEIDLRGMNEAGIYRTCAPEKDIHLLKVTTLLILHLKCFRIEYFFVDIQEQLLHGRIRAGEMNSYSVHVIAGVVKSFLSSLKEPLVTYTSRELFTKIAYIDDDTDVQTVVCSLVPELPQPNRDTLAFLILHLQRFYCFISHSLSHGVNTGLCFFYLYQYFKNFPKKKLLGSRVVSVANWQSQQAGFDPSHRQT